MNIEQCVNEIETIINSDEQNRCFFIDGDWGIGKTFGVKEKFKEAIYISLFGIDSKDALNNSFENELLNISLINNDDGKNLLNTTTDIISNISNEKLNNNDVKNKKSFLRLISTLNVLPKFLDLISLIRNIYVSMKDISNKVIIIDDIERAKLDLVVIEGFVDYLINNKKAKVILIGNLKQYETENNKEKEIAKLKDKLTDIYFFINEISNETICKVLEIKLDNDTNILKFIASNEIKNLRVMQKAKKAYHHIKKMGLSEDDEFDVDNLLKMVILDIYNTDIRDSLLVNNNNKVQSIGDKKDGSNIIESLVKNHLKSFVSYLDFKYYTPENLILSFRDMLKKKLIDGENIIISDINYQLKFIIEEYKDKPFKHMTNDEIKDFINDDKNDYFIDNISEFGNYLRRVDRIIEYNNNVGSFQENEKLMQKYEERISSRSKELIDYILDNKKVFRHMLIGMFEMLNNKEMLKESFKKIIELKITNDVEENIYLINNNIDNKQLFKNINKLKSIIYCFDDISFKDKIAKIKFEIRDVVYDKVSEGNLVNIFNFLARNNFEYLAKVMHQFKNVCFNNISAKIVYRELLNRFETLEKEANGDTIKKV